jgi:DEAD/DEAH box helicase domain-containing protein
VAADALDFLSGHGLLHPVHSRDKTVYHWASDAYPANDVSLRSVGWDNFVIIDVEREKTIAELDWRATHTMLHEQAIYQHEGDQYQVERLDFENHKAFVRRVGSDYFTTAMTHVRVAVIEVGQLGSLRGDLSAGGSGEGSPHDPERGGAVYGRGDVSVVEKVVGYKKIRYHTHENVGYGEVNLPQMQMHTSAFWLTVPESIVLRQGVLRAQVIDAMRGIAHALHTVASVGLMTDPSDLGTTIGDAREPGGVPEKGAAGVGFDPTVFLYDRVPGGVGLAPRIYQSRGELLRRARALIDTCDCEQGCPSCVGPRGPVDPTLGSCHKRIALGLLTDLGVAGTH